MVPNPSNGQDNIFSWNLQEKIIRIAGERQANVTGEAYVRRNGQAFSVGLFSNIDFQS